MRTTKRTTIVTVIIAAPLLLLGIVGCSQEPTEGSTPKSQAELEKAAKSWDVAHAKCLRAEGIDAPDPTDEQNGIALQAGGDPAAITRAMKTCQERVTKELGKRPVTAAEKKSQQAAIEKQRKSAACVREKGYEMPDAESSEGGAIISSTMPDIPEDVMKACGMMGGSVPAQK